MQEPHELEFNVTDADQWVSVCAPERSAAGFTLILFKRRIPMLIDLNGSVVHAWPQARAKGRVRLLPNGHLLMLSPNNGLVELDWGGSQTWSYLQPAPEYFPHHDLCRLSNGNTLAIFRDGTSGTDDLLEITKLGAVVWAWRSRMHLAAEIEVAQVNEIDKTHFNSVQELPPNRFFDAGDSRFRPGNLLVSARELNMVFIINRETLEVVWRYTDGLDYQHEAHMIRRDLPGGGNIMVFNNRYHDLGSYRQSQILEIDPQGAAVVWSYTSPTFFSETGGAQQRLANGNTLISSSRGNRCFEVEPTGEIVWQWSPPFSTMREIRYAKDHCPQLAALPSAELRPRAPDPDNPYIDDDLSRFGLRKDFRKTEIEDESARVLEQPELCRELWLPNRPVLELEYGFDTERFPRFFPTRYNAAFRATIQDVVGGEERVLVEDTMTSTERAPWRRAVAELPELSRARVQICLKATTSPNRPLKGGLSPAAWKNPLIRSANAAPEGADELPDSDNPTIIEQHLRALGYVD